MSDQRATVVVTTLYRHSDLEQCLDAISRMDVVPDVTIVVARAEDEVSHSVARSRGASVVHVTVPGLAAAIEAALGAVNTEFVAFVDDDARPHADWLARITDHFRADSSLGFVGGRDNVHGDDVSGSVDLAVGRLVRGKLVGNHHLGKGVARWAMHAKGANMAYRAKAVQDLPLGALVRGTGAQHGNELFLGFAALKRGYTGLYDPLVQVDHYPAVRQLKDERLNFSPERIDADIRNSAGAIGLYLGKWEWLLYLGRAFAIGDRNRPGLVWMAVHAARRSISLTSSRAVFSAVVRAARDQPRLRAVAARDQVLQLENDR